LPRARFAVFFARFADCLMLAMNRLRSCGEAPRYLPRP
jgi:hypothetical protein